MKKKVSTKWKIVLLVLVVCAIAAYLLYAANAGYLSVVQKNWDLPFHPYYSYKEVYQTDSGPSFTGDGWRYHVIEFKNEKKLDSYVDWAEGTVFHHQFEAEETLDQLGVEDELRPPYDQCDSWYRNGSRDKRDKIVLFQTGSTLYVVENFF